MANAQGKKMAGSIGSTDNSICSSAVVWLVMYVVDDNPGVDGSSSNPTGPTKSLFRVSVALEVLATW